MTPQITIQLLPLSASSLAFGNGLEYNSTNQSLVATAFFGRFDELYLFMNDIELIKSKINIVDSISEYLTLKKAGVNFKAICPFHAEKTPSFIVSPERQIWHCFSCGKGGDIFKFLMEKEGMEFKDALEYLAKKAGVILNTKTIKKDGRDRLFEVNLKAQEFFHYILTKHKLGEQALEYLHKRGLSGDTIEAFGIGYALNSWESLTKFLLKRKFTVAELVNAGVAVESNRGCYDRFRGRITFPLIDQKDKIVAFSGRVLGGGEPKYINTPQTQIFDKSQFLFGIQRSKGEIKAKNVAILVEGEMDVIMSYQSGIKNVVASKGTALTDGQIELLKKYTENLLICFDTDLAGDSAARRGIEMADTAGMNMKVIEVKGGKDPAEMALSDPESWKKAVEEAVPIYDWYLDTISKRYDTKDSSSIKKISDELFPIWAKINNDLEREHYIQKLSALLRTDEEMIRSKIASFRRSSSQLTNYSQVLRSGKDDLIRSVNSRRDLLEEYLISLLLHIPKDYVFKTNFPDERLLTSENLRQVYVLLVIYLDSISFRATSFNIQEFIKSVPEGLVTEVDRLYLNDLNEKLTTADVWQKELTEVIAELKKALIKASLEKLSLEIKNAQEFGKIETLESLTKRFRDLSVKLKNL